MKRWIPAYTCIDSDLRSVLVNQEYLTSTQKSCKYYFIISINMVEKLWTIKLAHVQNDNNFAFIMKIKQCYLW